MTDPLTGRAIEAAAATYRVPAGMAPQIRARDGVCRAPGTSAGRKNQLTPPPVRESADLLAASPPPPF